MAHMLFYSMHCNVKFTVFLHVASMFASMLCRKYKNVAFSPFQFALYHFFLYVTWFLSGSAFFLARTLNPVYLRQPMRFVEPEPLQTRMWKIEVGFTKIFLCKTPVQLTHGSNQCPCCSTLSVKNCHV